MRAIVRRTLHLLVLLLLCAAIGLTLVLARPEKVLPPPPQRDVPSIGTVIRLVVEYDAAFAEQHGADAEAFVREAVAMQNIEWQRYRRTWFEIAEFRLHDSGVELDASHVLAKMVARTPETPGTIHVFIVGRPLEVYTTGTSAVQIAGLAYRGSDLVLISSTPAVSRDGLAYYLFHELGHCWDALDVPFRGGVTTYSSSTPTFDVDAGNQEIINDSAGPEPRSSSSRGPAFLARKLASAKALVKNTSLHPVLDDLLLHEASPANPAYVRKKAAVLVEAGAERMRIETLLQQYEITAEHLADDGELRELMAAHYWRANDAILTHDYELAEVELDALRATAASAPDVHMLIGAVTKTIRKRR